MIPVRQEKLRFRVSRADGRPAKLFSIGREVVLQGAAELKARRVDDRRKRA